MSSGHLKRAFTSSNHQFSGDMSDTWVFRGVTITISSVFHHWKIQASSYDRDLQLHLTDPLKGPVNSYVLEFFFLSPRFPFYLQHPFFSPRFRRDRNHGNSFGWHRSVKKQQKKPWTKFIWNFRVAWFLFCFFPTGLFRFLVMGKLIHFLGMAFFHARRWNPLPCLGSWPEGPCALDTAVAWTMQKIWGCNFAKLLLVWLSGGLVGCLVGWLVGGWFLTNHLENMQMVVKLDHLTSIDKWKKCLKPPPCSSSCCCCCGWLVG